MVECFLLSSLAEAKPSISDDLLLFKYPSQKTSVIFMERFKQEPLNSVEGNLPPAPFKGRSYPSYFKAAEPKRHIWTLFVRVGHRFG